MKKTIIIALVLLALIGCQKQSSKEMGLDAIKESKVMVVGYTHYPPLGFKDSTGKETGLDLDLAKVVGEKMGVDVKFQYIDWDNKVFELNNGNIDMIWNGFTVTEERAKEVNFGKPYMDNEIIVLSRNDKPISTINELKGLDVAVETQSSGEIALMKNYISKEINEIQKYTSVADALLALNAKTVDAIIVDITFAGYTQKLNPNKYTVSSDSFDSEYYAIGFRKDDDDLKNEIDNILDSLIKDGTTTSISIDWLGKDVIRRP